jgi:hypothetical protein
VAAYENYRQEGGSMSPREGVLRRFIELTDVEILAIWEKLEGHQNLLDFARACIAASFKQ